LTAGTGRIAVVPAVDSAGAYDITGGNYVSYIQAQQEHRANLDIVAEGSVMEPGTQGIYTLPDSPVATLADLKSQTIAINAPDNILFLLTASVLAEHGVSPSSVHFASIPFPEMPDELKSAAVSAAVMPEPALFGVSAETAAVMALDAYPVSTGPVGSVDKIRLQRVVDVMQRFLGFGKFDIGSMLMGSASSTGG